jgi:phosphate starvation-inducible PhoH-like protein
MEKKSFNLRKTKMADNISKNPPKGKVKFNITLSEEQKDAKSNILYHPYNFLLGKAGSGKTLLAVQVGLDMFFTRQINKIVITRPTVSNEDNGYLPGSLNEKMEPWLVPIRSNMRKVYNKPAILQKMENDENIELVSLSHFRGRTFENSCVIVDEFQNLTKQQLSMVLGRLGKGSTMILTGDPQQIDLKFSNDSAVHDVPKLKPSQYVYSISLQDNHRHEALDELLKLLQNYS